MRLIHVRENDKTYSGPKIWLTFNSRLYYYYCYWRFRFYLRHSFLFLFLSVVFYYSLIRLFLYYCWNSDRGCRYCCLNISRTRLVAHKTWLLQIEKHFFNHCYGNSVSLSFIQINKCISRMNLHVYIFISFRFISFLTENKILSLLSLFICRKQAIDFQFSLGIFSCNFLSMRNLRIWKCTYYWGKN